MMIIKPPSVGPILGHRAYSTTSVSQKVLIRGNEEWATQTGFLFITSEGKSFEKSYKISIGGVTKDYTGNITLKALPLDTAFNYRVGVVKGNLQKSDFFKIKGGKRGSFVTYNNTKPTTSFIFGSCCHFPLLGGLTKADDAAFRIIEKKYLSDDFILMTGDQIYGDHKLAKILPKIPSLGTIMQTLKEKPEKLTFDHYNKHYKKAFKRKHKRRVMGSLPTYMIFDDHEVHNNWSGGLMKQGYLEMKDKLEGKKNPLTGKILKDALNSYNIYQASHSPLEASDLKPKSNTLSRYFYEFTQGVSDFFVMDVRFERDRKAGVLMDKRQKNALLNFLSHGTNRVKFIVTAVPFFPDTKAVDFETDPEDKWFGYQKERKEILDAIKKENKTGNKNFIFLTGDVHCSFAGSLSHTVDKTFKIHQITSSAFNWGIGLNDRHFKKSQPLEGAEQYKPKNLTGKVVTKDNFCRVVVQETRVNVCFYYAKSGKKCKQDVNIPLVT